MRKIPSSEITQFLSELGTLLQSQLSCQEALNIVQQEQDHRALSQLIATIHTEVKQGGSLADSLAKYPQYFEPFLITLLRDEKELATTLLNFVKYREAMEVGTTNLTHRLRTSLSYFAVVLLILLSLAVLMLGYVIPVFENLYATFGGNLPGITQGFITLSRGFVAYWWLIGGGLLLLGSGLWMQRNQVILNVPLVGPLYRKIALVRFLHTSAFMLSHRATLAQALQAAAQTVNSSPYARRLQQLSEQVASGTTLPEALLKQPAFPTKVVHAAIIGTQTQQLDQWLLKLATIYTKQLHQTIAPTVKLLNLAAIIFIGVLVGLFVLAMYIPIFKMGGNI